jgi:mannose-6-phosphate isomerase-like protein (cupin superfamily)
MHLAPSRPATRPRNGIDLLKLVQRIADTGDWREHVQLPQGDERWWTRLESGDDVDVWLLSWLPGHATDLHDHGGSTAAFAVVEGALREIRLDRGGHRFVKERRAGSATVVPPSVIHDVHGSGIQAAVSIHAYSPPLRQMNFYAVDPTGRPRLVDSADVDGPER